LFEVVEEIKLVSISILNYKEWLGWPDSRTHWIGTGCLQKGPARLLLHRTQANWNLGFEEGSEPIQNK
jgi:hypothetical protein